MKNAYPSQLDTSQLHTENAPTLKFHDMIEPMVLHTEIKQRCSYRHLHLK